MTENILLPPDLNVAIGSENKDFVVKAERAQPLRKSFYVIFFGLFWTGFTSIFVISFFGPLLLGKEINFKVNGSPTVASLNNLGPVIVPALLIILFVMVGVGVLSYGLYSVFKKGGYFVGTPNRLVYGRNGSVRSIDWEQFSGDIEVRGRPEKGDVYLQMRTGQMVSQKRGPDRYVPDVIYMCGINNAFEIEKICRKRIKENDPTPPNAGHDIA